MELNDSIPDYINRHLQSVTESSGLPNDDSSRKRIASAWVEKRRLVEQQLEALDMIEVDRLDEEDPRAVLALTYSGSLVALGPETGRGRRLEYASIKLRADVPELVQSDLVTLAAPIAKDAPVELKDTPMRASSPAFILATFSSEVSPKLQDARLREAMLFLTNGFVKLNRTIALPVAEAPDQFTKTTMVAYLAKRHGLAQKQTREVLDDYLKMVEAGMLLGERVGLGRIGRVFLAKRPAQTARVGRNPATGEEITISAKPATAVPRASFSTHLKDRAGQLPVELMFPDDADE